MKEAIRTKGLTKRFGERVGIDDVTFELSAPEDGRVIVLLGPNGAGKSTLLRLILGLAKPDSGEIDVLGLDPVRDADRLHERVAHVPDTPDVPDWMTVEDLFRFLAPRYPAWDSDCAARLVGHGQVPTKTPFRLLSRGQAAKAMLVAAVAQSPELIVLDEPFSGLDPVARREFLQTFIEELDRLGSTALVATHDLDVASRIADEVIVLREGNVAACGPVADVLGETDHEPARLPNRLLKLLESLTPDRKEITV